MKFENIKYSKCPNCKKHGLPFYKTGYKYNPIVICKFCGKKLSVNRFLSMTALIVMIASLGVACQIIDDIPSWMVYLLGIAFWLVFQYFAPLEEYEEK